MQHLTCNQNHLMYRRFFTLFKAPSDCSARLFASVNVKTSINQITIPKAIKRSSIDILETLSATVKTDSSGPHYKYVDDPYLTPVSNVEKRTFSLSKEAGRKAAHYFFDKYPQYFYRDTSEPKIEAFTYKEIYDDGMEFSEFDLEKSISRSDVSNAIICYSNLTKENKQIKEETLLDLLDLVAFYNCENLQDKYAEEEWFKKNVNNRNEINLWKDNGFAEQLFDQFPTKNSRAYSSVIQGMCKYMQTARAFSHYKQANDLNLSLNVEAYNALISSSYNLHQTNEERWKTIVDILKNMNNNQIRPNVGTLNAVLKQISKYRFWNLNFDVAKKTFNEFAFKFNIKPTLATYHHLLTIFYRNKSSRSSLIYEIIDRISNEKLEIQDIDDVNFFAFAMEICLNLNDLQLAYKVHQLAENNGKLLGAGANQSYYYNKFLQLLCSAESIENFMIIYTKYVPHYYSPTFDLMDRILKTIKIYKALNYIPQIWNDLILLGYTNNIDLMQNLLSSMDEATKDEPLLQTFANIVVDLVERINQSIDYSIAKGKSQMINWNAKSLSHCISILIKAENLASAFEVFCKLDELKDELLDQPDSQALIGFCIKSIVEENYEYTQFCLKFCKDMDLRDVLVSIVKEAKNIDMKQDKIRKLLKNFEN